MCGRTVGLAPGTRPGSRITVLAGLAVTGMTPAFSQVSSVDSPSLPSAGSLSFSPRWPGRCEAIMSGSASGSFSAS